MPSRSDYQSNAKLDTHLYEAWNSVWWNIDNWSRDTNDYEEKLKRKEQEYSQKYTDHAKPIKK